MIHFSKSFLAKNINRFALSLLFFATTVFGTTANAALQTQANVMIEINFTSSRAYSDPFNEVVLDVVFKTPKGDELRVPAFWAGTNVWKVRYASPITGTHSFRTECSQKQDPGLDGITGQVKVKSYRGQNALLKHGPIQVAADKRHFQHTDGTPFFWLGDTWWMGLCHRLHFPQEFAQLAEDRRNKGFNVIQIVAGLYPDMHPFDPRGANEAGFPWETNYTAIRPQYFNEADKRINYLVDQGFTPCIVGAWGYFLPWMGVEKAKQHWRELTARYGAMPVVWCVAGEANLPWYLAKGFPYDDRELVHGWTEVTRYIHATDPFHRVTTIHPTGIGKLNSRWAIDDASLIDFDMLQTPHGQSGAVAPTIAAFNHAYNLPPKMPVLNGEASYEMLNGQIVAQWPRAMFWLCMINGAAGHTYGANGIWQVNRRDQPHGASPHGGNYGTIPWDESMHLPGSQQIGDAKKFLARFPWEKCEPQPDTVTSEVSPVPHWKKWIWFPEGEPATHAPLEKRFFRREFDLANDAIPTQAFMHVSADNKATVWLNGKQVGEAADWQSPPSFDATTLLKPGKNIIAVEAENQAPPINPNPAGLMVSLEMRSGKNVRTIGSDESWRSSKTATGAWQNAGFTDSDWKPAKVIAKYGEGPWGKIGNSDSSFTPYALGIGEKLRIVYALSPRAITVTKLRPKAQYRFTEFDPVTGQSRKGTIRTDDEGQWHSPAPTHGHDWAIALELK